MMNKDVKLTDVSGGGVEGKVEQGLTAAVAGEDQARELSRT